MTVRRTILPFGLLTLALAGVAVAAVAVENAKCPISGKDCVEDSATDYRDGHIYFCCNNCPKAFAKDKTKFATMANHQLVTTGQYEQTGCPVSGHEIVEGTEVTVGGVEVGFCCEKCQAKVAAAEGDQQVNLVFADAAFEKAFSKKVVAQ